MNTAFTKRPTEEELNERFRAVIPFSEQKMLPFFAALAHRLDWSEAHYARTAAFVERLVRVCSVHEVGATIADVGLEPVRQALTAFLLNDEVAGISTLFRDQQEDHWHRLANHVYWHAVKSLETPGSGGKWGVHAADMVLALDVARRAEAAEQWGRLDRYLHGLRLIQGLLKPKEADYLDVFLTIYNTKVDGTAFAEAVAIEIYGILKFGSVYASSRRA